MYYGPTLEGFIAFVRGQNITAAELPDNSEYFPWAFWFAKEQVYNPPGAVDPMTYKIMVYNLGTDTLVNYAEDIPPNTTFKSLRKALNLTNFVPGLVQSTSDNGDSTSLMIPDAFKELTLQDLQLLKTPWGQRYLALAQNFGSIWGLT
jgi:hypothetical protein